MAMSNFYGKWAVEDVRDVLRLLDAKNAMNGASIHIGHCKTLVMVWIWVHTIPVAIIAGIAVVFLAVCWGSFNSDTS